MEMQFEKQSFGKRLKSMLKVDFKRMFTMPLVYIIAGISLLMPILILVMTTMVSKNPTIDPVTGAETAANSFTNVWQAIGSMSGTMAMDLTGMCNINMMYFLIAVFVCIFVAEDFKSGYAKNMFTVRAKKTDYIISKSLAGFTGGVISIVCYFIGAMLGGAIAGLSFDAGTAGAGGIVACLFTKLFLTVIFSSVALLLGTVAKQKLWISILGSLGASMLLFTMIPMIAPLNAGIMNVILSLLGGGLFAASFGAVGNIILKKTNLV